MTRPTVAITMGDPAGIGSEVIMKALAIPDTQAICNALVIGDANRLRKAGQIVGASLEVEALGDAKDASFPSKAVQCVGQALREPRAERHVGRLIHHDLDQRIGAIGKSFHGFGGE